MMRAGKRAKRAQVRWLITSVVLASGAMLSVGGLVTPGSAQTSGCDSSALSLDTRLSGATLNEPYFGVILASGGTEPYTFKIVQGSLPPELTLDPSSGHVQGTPLLPGDFAFTVQVVDSSIPAECKTIPAAIHVSTGTPAENTLQYVEAVAQNAPSIVQRLVSEGPYCVQRQLNTLLGGGPPDPSCMGLVPLPPLP
jgi:hypothetical protein